MNLLRRYGLWMLLLLLCFLGHRQSFAQRTEYPFVFNNPTLGIGPLDYHFRAGFTTAFFLFSDSAILNKVRTIDFDLDYNSDLLQFREATASQGYVVVTKTGNHFHIEGAPVIPGHQIAEFIFTIMVTKDSTSDISINNIHLNQDDPTFEQDTAFATSNSTSTFASYYGCDEPLLSKFLRDGTLRIVGVQPNPVVDKTMTIHLQQPVDGILTISCIDMNGRRKTLFSGEVVHGSQSVPLQLEGLIAGDYVLLLNSANSSRTEKVSIR